MRDLALNRKVGLFLLPLVLWIIVIHQYTSEEVVVGILEMRMAKGVEGIDPVAVTERAAEAVRSSFAGTIKSGEALYADFVKQRVEWKEFCENDPSCPFELGAYAHAHEMIVSSLAELAPGRYRLEAQIFHLRTHRIGRKEHDTATAEEIPERLAGLYARLLGLDLERIELSIPPEAEQSTEGFGALAIETSPPGATIFLDGQRRGRSPLTLTGLPVGLHDLSIRLENHFPVEWRVSVHRGVTRRLPVELRSSLGRLAVSSTPPGAAIFLDGEDTGKRTPALLEDLEAGEHRLLLRLPHYFDQEDAAFVYPARKAEIDWTMRGKPARFTIEGTPKGAQVYADKLFHGYAPLELTLSPEEEHTLVVHQPGFQARVDKLRGGIDEARSFRYELEREGKGPGSGEMVRIPAGSFTMGSSTKEIIVAMRLCPSCGAEDFKIEQPQRKVFLKTYAIDRYEVTNSEYTRCVAAGVCKETPFLRKEPFNAPLQPVVGVMYEDAEAYCRWVGKRMPTEAEWEKAARGTDRRLFPWGWESDCSRASHTEGLGYDCRETQPRHPMPVGSFPQGKSPYGVYDMAGNVWEWVSDYFSDAGYTGLPRKNPTGPPPSPEGWRVLRGGSWSDGIVDLRAASRVCSCAAPEYLNALGFRCARDE